MAGGSSSSSIRCGHSSKERPHLQQVEEVGARIEEEGCSKYRRYYRRPHPRSGSHLGGQRRGENDERENITYILL